MFATTWLTTRPMLQRSKRRRREPLPKLKHCKTRNKNSTRNFPVLAPLLLLGILGLGVLLVLSHQVLVISVPKANILTQSDRVTCATNAAEEVIGQSLVPSKINLSPQDQNLDLDQYEFEQCAFGSGFSQGKLHAHFSFWHDTVKASDFVLDVIQHGYKIIFLDSPSPYSIENRSAVRQDSFVQEAI